MLKMVTDSDHAFLAMLGACQWCLETSRNRQGPLSWRYHAISCGIASRLFRWDRLMGREGGLWRFLIGDLRRFLGFFNREFVVFC